MDREEKSSCCACGERVMFVVEEAERERADAAVEGMGFPKKYDLI